MHACIGYIQPYRLFCTEPKYCIGSLEPMSAAPLFENRGSPLISRPDNNALIHLSRRRAIALPSSLHSMPPTTRRTAPTSGSSDGSEQARPPDPPRRTPRRTPKILPKLNAKDKSTHSGFKIKAESAMRAHSFFSPPHRVAQPFFLN